MSTWKIRVGSRSFDVDVKERGYGDYEVTLDGQVRGVTVQQADWGVDLQVPGGAAPAFGTVQARHAPVLPGAARVAPDVKAKPAEAREAVSRPAAPAAPAPAVVFSGNAITSPMPGRVIRLLVKQGQEIKAGDPVVVLESMKMENTVVAPRAGRIAALNVKIGDTPNTGHPIATYE